MIKCVILTAERCIACVLGGTVLQMNEDSSTSSLKLDSEASLIMDMILEDDDITQLPTKFAEYIGYSNIVPKFVGKAPMMPQNSGSGTINWGPPPPPS